MKKLKALLIAVFTVAAFAVAQAQIHLPPPPPHPPHPPLPNIHIRLHRPTAPPPPSRVVVVKHRSGHVVRRHYYYKNGRRHYRTY